MEQPQHPANGQVLRNTEFGHALFLLAAIPQYKTYLEIGTWKGNGTTRCVVDGLLHRLQEKKEEVHFWSLEANKQFQEEARKLWEPAALPFLHLMYGKLHSDGLMSADEIKTHAYFGHVKTHFELWYEQDVIDYGRAPTINIDLLPPQIDVVILDGGEFCGYADWLAVKSKNPTVVCLDDVGVMKNERVYKELKEDPIWELRVDRQDRHGWAIFERR